MFFLAQLLTARRYIGGDYDEITHQKHAQNERPDYSQKADHDLLILAIERLDTMKEDLKDAKKNLALIHCPGVQCLEHDKRIGKIESSTAWQWIVIVGLAGFSVIQLSMLWGHVTNVIQSILIYFLSGVVGR